MRELIRETLVGFSKVQAKDDSKRLHQPAIPLDVENA